MKIRYENVKDGKLLEAEVNDNREYDDVVAAFEELTKAITNLINAEANLVNERAKELRASF